MAKKFGFEGSAKDKREDKSQAKKAGMSMKKWEKSPGDKKADKAGGKKFFGFGKKGKR